MTGVQTCALPISNLIKDTRVALSHEDALARHLLPKWLIFSELHDGGLLASVDEQDVLVLGVGELENPVP